ncbi:N-acetylglutamate synthase, mitochondrial [Arapaima gigas]
MSMIHRQPCHTGSGTLFENADPVHRYSSLDEMDVERLLVSIDSSFEKSLKDRLHSVYRPAPLMVALLSDSTLLPGEKTEVMYRP